MKKTRIEKSELEKKILVLQDRLEKTEQKLQSEIKEKARLETKLRHAQKMEAIATLAGGIAHDFNNILWIINGNSELAMANMANDHPLRPFLERIDAASRKASNLVRQILSFSHPSGSERKKLKISSIIKESLKLLRSTLPSTIDIRTNILSESFTIIADLSQINQALMNLFTNAAHAMRENGGILEVSLTGMEINEKEVLQATDLVPGKYAVLTIRDTGPGISAEIIDRIFEPYFTTRQETEGSGMGLTVANEIIREHNGIITVHSEPGKGTVFHVFLPDIDSENENAIQKANEDFPKGNERILFVDDEEALIETGGQMLKLLGYRVTTCKSSTEAIKIFKKKPGQFDLIVTDQTMPHMTGDMLAKEIMALRSDIPIILCTGFSDRISKEKAEQENIDAFLHKPVLMGDLARTVRKVLDLKNK